jgi:nitroreductase
MAETVFDKPVDLGLQPPPPKINAEEFVKVIESRRSVRVYDTIPIPESITRQCLKLALLAPNSSNLQPWEFYWVRSPDKKAELVKACLSQPSAQTAAELIVCVARTKTWKKWKNEMLATFKREKLPIPQAVLDYYQKLVPFVYTQGPLVILGWLKKILFFAVGFFKPVPREPTSHNDMKIWAVKSTALACENLMLAFRAFGFDSCPMEGIDSSRIKSLLQLPRDATILMVVSAGKRVDSGVYGPRLRFDEKNFLFEV